MPRPEHLQAVDEAVLGSPDVRRRLAALPGLPINFDRAEIRRDPLPPGWAVTNVHQSLPAESPGPPMPDGSFAVAQRLMRGYHFADPSIVRAYYDPSVPLARRNMLLKLQALRLLHLWAPVRVVDVFERGDRDEHGQIGRAHV